MAIERRAPVADRIVQLIRQRELGPGDPMPTELELIDELGVSRNTVREAIRELRAWGIVDVRHGYGTFVAEATLAALTPSLVFRAVVAGPKGLAALRYLVEVRELLETGVAPRLIATIDEAKAARLNELCDQMADPDRMEVSDRRFHRELYADLDNPLIGQLVDVFWDAYHDANQQFEQSSRDAVLATSAAHRDIVTAIRSGDARAAQSAVRDHFRGIYERLDALA